VREESSLAIKKLTIMVAQADWINISTGRLNYAQKQVLTKPS